MPGAVLCRIARALCSEDSCRRVLEPAIADLQHEYIRAGQSPPRRRALVRGYMAFWQSLGWCLAREAFSSEARAFNARAAAAFVVAVSAAEALLMHASTASRLYVLTHFPHVGWSARTDTATLRFGIPLALFPALFHATRRAGFTAAGALRALAAGVASIIIASGWLAPAVERARSLSERARFVTETKGRYYLPPIEWQLDRYPPGKAWPDLIRGAVAPARHRYPGYPHYVAPEDRDLGRFHRLVIYDRLDLLGLGLLAGLLGCTMGRPRRPAHSGGLGRE